MVNEIEKEAWRLREEWVKAANRLTDDDSDRNILLEQEAYDALVDFVEDNDLNYTKYDPRGMQ